MSLSVDSEFDHGCQTKQLPIAPTVATMAVRCRPSESSALFEQVAPALLISCRS
jgi:hypothetical protein